MTYANWHFRHYSKGTPSSNLLRYSVTLCTRAPTHYMLEQIIFHLLQNEVLIFFLNKLNVLFNTWHLKVLSVYVCILCWIHTFRGRHASICLQAKLVHRMHPCYGEASAMNENYMQYATLIKQASESSVAVAFLDGRPSQFFPRSNEVNEKNSSASRGSVWSDPHCWNTETLH